MSNEYVNAIAPELLAVISAAEAFVTNLGSDPLKLPLTSGPALTIFLNTVALQAAPALNAEWSTVQAEALTKLAALKAKLSAKPA